MFQSEHQALWHLAPGHAFILKLAGWQHGIEYSPADLSLLTYCAWNCTYHLYMKHLIAWIAIILSYSAGLRHIQIFMRKMKATSVLKATHWQIACLCFNIQDHQSCSLTKENRILRTEHFIFTVVSLKNSIIRQRFNHSISLLQFLVCNFLAGNFSFWE